MELWGPVLSWERLEKSEWKDRLRLQVEVLPD